MKQKREVEEEDCEGGRRRKKGTVEMDVEARKQMRPGQKVTQ